MLGEGVMQRSKITPKEASIKGIPATDNGTVIYMRLSSSVKVICLLHDEEKIPERMSDKVKAQIIHKTNLRLEEA